jgi:hypothetical protein
MSPLNPPPPNLLLPQDVIFQDFVGIEPMFNNTWTRLIIDVIH